MEFVVVFFLSLIVVILLVKQRKKNIKQSAVKKDEIIKDYERQLKQLLQDNSKENQIKIKTTFLKKVNDELSRNIYFDKTEIKTVIDKLLKI